MQSDELFTVEEVAERLKVNQQTVRNWIDAGRLAAIRLGARRVRVSTSALAAFLGESETQSSNSVTTVPGEPKPEKPKTEKPKIEPKRATASDVKVIERVIDTLIVTSAGLEPGSPLQRELAESAGRLQVALRVRDLPA